MADPFLETTTSGPLNNRLRRLLPKVGDTQIKADLKQFCANMEALIDKRNHLLHGIWGWYVNEKDQERNGRPANLFFRRRGHPFFGDEIEDLAKRVMAESQSIVSIWRRLCGLDVHKFPHPFHFGPGAARTPKNA